MYRASYPSITLEELKEEAKKIDPKERDNARLFDRHYLPQRIHTAILEDFAVGIPCEMLRKAASMAVCKINICTDLRVCYFGELRRQLAENPGKFDGPTLLVPARNAVTEMVAARITDVLGSSGKA